MSMGNIESYYQVVPEKTVIQVAGEAVVKKFLAAIAAVEEKEDDGSEDISEALNEDGWSSIDTDSSEWKALVKEYKELQDAFGDKTGMSLQYVYLAGDGDCYDDLDVGWYWVLDEDDVWSRNLTPAAKKFLKTYGDDAIDTDQRFSRYG